MNTTNKLPTERSAEELISEIISADLATAREAKIALSKLLRQSSAPNKKAHLVALITDRLLPEVPRSEDTKRSALIISMLGEFVVSLYATHEAIAAMYDLIITHITHEHGNVREATRRLANNWWVHGPSTTETLSPLKQDLLSFVRDRITELRPQGSIDPLDVLPASPYKTLLLLWEHTTDNPYMAKWLTKHPDLQIELPARSYEDEEWLEAHAVDREAVVYSLWEKEKVTRQTLQTFSQLEDLATKRFVSRLTERHNFSKTEAKQLCNRIKQADTEQAQEHFCFELADRCLKRNLSLHDISGIMREIQAVINHTVRNRPHTYSYFLLSCVSEALENGRPKPRDLQSILSEALAVHTQIDVFCSITTQQNNEQFNEILARMVKFGDSKELHKHFADERDGRSTVIREASAVAHHIWDWYAQIKSWHTKKEPEKYAALVYHVVKDINQDQLYSFLSYNNQQLASFGGWRSPGSISYTARDIQNEVLDRIIEPDMLLIAPMSDQEAFELSNTEDLAGPFLITNQPLGEVAPNHPRYFVVLTTDTPPLTPLQEQRLKTAVITECSAGDGLLEELLIQDDHVLLCLGIHYDTAPQSLIDNIILSANSNEPFLRFHFYITNTHRPSDADIKKYCASFLE